MSCYTTIGNVKWYHYLVVKEGHRSLFSDNPRGELNDKFIACWDYADSETEKTVKLYAVFKNYVHFVKFILTVPKHLRCFYEIILGEKPQKIHFDVDLDKADASLGKKVLSDLITAVVKVLSDIDISLNLSEDVCIYSSHGENKQSYHVIVNNWCHANHQEAKAFYLNVMTQLPPEYSEKKWIDSSVYSKTQQFRTFGSTKTQTDRYKQLVLTWSLGDVLINHVREISSEPEVQFLEDFGRSIVTASGRNCRLLPSFSETEPCHESKNTPFDFHISSDLAWEAIRLLANKAGVTPEHPKFPYRFSEIEGSLILLKRVRPSRCRVCNRIHENENPYLLYYPETGDVYFDCRRSAQGKKMYVGCLKVEDSESFESGEGSSDGNTNEKAPSSQAKNWYVEKIQQLAKKEIPRKIKKPKNVDETSQNNLIKNIRSQI